jgi:5-formyltetrahydrofolate cyclo-ligase
LAVSADPENPETSVVEAKARARAHAHGARAKAFVAAPAAGAHVRDRFLSELLPSLNHRDGVIVAGYIPVRDELDPRPLLFAMEERGYPLAAPSVVGRGAPLVFRRWDVYASLAPGHFGIPEPPPHAPVVEPDLLLVPLLAFDRRGHRLGYGRGYYDRTLAGLRARRPIIAVGLAFAAQEVLSLPISDDDQRLDWIVTEAALIHPKLE